MINAIRARCFKSWRDTERVRLAPLTGFFGSNSSGKSSITQVLLLLKQTAESPDRKRVLHTGDKRSLVDLGTFFDLIHGHESETAVTLGLEWSDPDHFTVPDPDDPRLVLHDAEDLSFETRVTERNGRAVVEEFSYRFDNCVLGMRRRQDSGTTKDEYDLIHEGYQANRVQGRAWPMRSPVKCYGFPDEATRYYQNTESLPDLVFSLESCLGRVAYLGPLRSYPERTYVWAGDKPVDVGRQGESAVAALLAAKSAGQKSGRGFGKARRYATIEHRIGEWLQKMGLVYSYTLKPIAPNRKDYELRVKQSAAGAEVLITDVGFGVSQILPVLVLCYYVPEGSTIILEQPEIHLHPKVQADLADVIIEVVQERNVQVILESHSEHLLRRIQRRVAEGTIASEKTALYFCQLQRGDSRIEQLRMNDSGRIDNWPTGFFGDELGELAAMTEAAIGRENRPS